MGVICESFCWLQDQLHPYECNDFYKGLPPTIGWGLITTGGRLLGIGIWCQIHIYGFGARLLRIGLLGCCAKCVVYPIHIALNVFLARIKLWLYVGMIPPWRGSMSGDVNIFNMFFYIYFILSDKVVKFILQLSMYYCKEGTTLPHSTFATWLKSKQAWAPPQWWCWQKSFFAFRRSPPPTLTTSTITRPCLQGLAHSRCQGQVTWNRWVMPVVRVGVGRYSEWVRRSFDDHSQQIIHWSLVKNTVGCVFSFTD